MFKTFTCAGSSDLYKSKQIHGFFKIHSQAIRQYRGEKNHVEIILTEILI